MTLVTLTTSEVIIVAVFWSLVVLSMYVAGWLRGRRSALRESIDMIKPDDSLAPLDSYEMTT